MFAGSGAGHYRITRQMIDGNITTLPVSPHSNKAEVSQHLYLPRDQFHCLDLLAASSLHQTCEKDMHCICAICMAIVCSRYLNMYVWKREKMTTFKHTRHPAHLNKAEKHQNDYLACPVFESFLDYDS